MKIRLSPYRRVPRKGFTMIEMVVVLAIIGILLAVAVSTLGGGMNFAYETKAKSEVQTISSALLKYRIDAGSYPTEAQGLKALKEKPTTAPIPRRWTKNDAVMLMDPWNSEYVYKLRGSKDPTQPEIISKGPDGQLGTDDDISSQGM